MESGLFTILETLINKGVLADTSLFLVIIAILIYGYKFVLSPILEHVKAAPSLDEIKVIAQPRNEVEGVNVEEISKKLDKIVEVLDEVEDFGRGNYREVKELKKDIEQIKTMLNQFQGHFMYNRSTNSGDFGNRELR